VEKIDFEVGHFRKFRTSLTVTLTLDRVIQHTVVYHFSTYIYNFVEIGKKLIVDVRTYGRTDVRTDIEIGCIRSEST